MENTENISEKK